MDSQALHAALKQYWGYDSFRPLQEDIIISVLQGKDTLALLPTGGGKSICFQVPTLVRTGLCVVVSPLIALMKDQVENLKKRGIKAVAVYSGMSAREIDRTLDNCVYGDTRFLYVSPERLTTDLFRARVQRMRVSLLAVDEAHCVSQWGYDFRPEYLRIPELRQLLPHVPVLALTASATHEVVKDIQEKLGFRQANVFRKSFFRDNLHYHVRVVEDKQAKLTEICSKLPGTGIVYVRNRKATRMLAMHLQRHSISADFYHAGLNHEDRERKQDNWRNNRTRVMVCTNAFGMGIDKPDVRFVVHYEMPDGPESYYQEAGRAGRDEKRAFAVLLFNNADKTQALTRFEQSQPDEATVKRVYGALGSYFNLAIGGGQFQSFDFDIAVFCAQYKLPATLVYNALKVLEQDEYLCLSEAVHQPSRIMVRVTNADLYKFQVANARFDPFIKMVMRMYGGVFDDYVRIHEGDIAVKSKLTTDEVITRLTYLHKHGIIDYVQQSDVPRVTYLTERLESNNVGINRKLLKFRYEVTETRLNAMIRYGEQKTLCRSRYLLTYFNEEATTDCGTCDVCLRKKPAGNGVTPETGMQQLQTKLQEGAYTLQQLVKSVNLREETAIELIRTAIENSWIKQHKDGTLTWNPEGASFLP